MQKKYIVRLTDDERDILRSVVKKLKGSSQKVRRAQMLLKADADGPNWPDRQIAEAFSCRTKTVENVRQKLVTEGFDASLNRKKRDTAPRTKLLDGEQEARVIALRLGKPPEGYANWSLRLLAEKVVELEIVESISYETVRRTLKKTVLPNERFNTGSFLLRPTVSLWQTWKMSWRPTRGPMMQLFPLSVWMNSRSNC